MNDAPGNGSAALSAWRDEETSTRIAVTAWHPIFRADDQFIERRRNARMLWEYWLRVGFRAVLLKVRSRIGEKQRNRKIAAIGSGVVLESSNVAGLPPDTPVLFFAPNHPENAREIVVHDDFFVPVPEVLLGGSVAPNPSEIPDTIRDLVGWSPYSGYPTNRDSVRDWLEALRREFFEKPEPGTALRSHGNRQLAATRIDRTASHSGKPTAVLFGLGNYAKTLIVPNIRRELSLTCIHEIDPAQIRTADAWGISLDTKPIPREDERYDAWFIAGFHHTHAAIAETALRSGAYAVVEKPLATTRAQYESIRECIESTATTKLFTCYQRRHSLMNQWLRQDMNLTDGDPVNFHCIVYEIPLPARHWYNWPESGSRITSNGCHWIDHFLYLNQYAPVIAQDVRATLDGDFIVTLQLENSAFFTMTLTERGSGRLGVRDYVEARHSDVTVQMVDQSSYFAESTARRLRKKKINLITNYSQMYRNIVDTIVAGGSGDETESLASTLVTIELEEALESS